MMTKGLWIMVGIDRIKESLFIQLGCWLIGMNFHVQAGEVVNCICRQLTKRNSSVLRLELASKWKWLGLQSRFAVSWLRIPYTPSLNLNNFRQLACTVYFRPFVVQKSCQDVESRFLVGLTGFLPLVNTLKFLQAMNKWENLQLMLIHRFLVV